RPRNLISWSGAPQPSRAATSPSRPRPRPLIRRLEPSPQTRGQPGTHLSGRHFRVAEQPSALVSMEFCRLFHAVFEHLEIVLGQVSYQISPPVNDDRVATTPLSPRRR